MIALLLAMAVCASATALAAITVVRLSRESVGSGMPGGIRSAPQSEKPRSATITRVLLIVTVALVHCALTFGAVALALWFMREPNAEDDCDSADECRTVLLKVEATSTRHQTFRSAL